MSLISQIKTLRVGDDGKKKRTSLMSGIQSLKKEREPVMPTPEVPEEDPRIVEAREIMGRIAEQQIPQEQKGLWSKIKSVLTSPGELFKAVTEPKPRMEFKVGEFIEEEEKAPPIPTVEAAELEEKKRKAREIVTKKPTPIVREDPPVIQAITRLQDEIDKLKPEWLKAGLASITPESPEQAIEEGFIPIRQRDGTYTYVDPLAVGEMKNISRLAKNYLSKALRKGKPEVAKQAKRIMGKLTSETSEKVADDLMRQMKDLSKGKIPTPRIKPPIREARLIEEVAEEVVEEVPTPRKPIKPEFPKLKEIPIDERPSTIERITGKEIRPIKKVANIRLDKFNTSDEIAEQIAKSSRGVKLAKVTNKELLEMSNALDTTPEKLMNKWKRNKILTKEEALTADRLAIKQAENVINLQKKVQQKPLDVKLKAQLEQELLLSRGLQEMAAGNRRQAGQLVQQYRMIRDILTDPQRTLQEIQKILGDDFNKLTDELAKINLEDRAQVVRFIQKYKRAGFFDKVYEFWINALLSAPTTHIVNMTGNALYSAFRPIIKGVTAGLDFATSGAGKFRPREVYLGEAAADIVGMQSAFREGISRALEILKNGIDYSLITKLEDIPAAAIKGKKGEAIRLPGRFLVAMDEFFKAINHSGAMNAMLYKEAKRAGMKDLREIAEYIGKAKKNPTPEMLEKATQIARKYVFQSELGKSGQALMGVRRKVPGARIVLPFLKTPINITKEGLSLTPLNIYKVLKKGLSREEKLEAAARATIGVFVTAGLYNMVMDERVTGAAPRKKNERDAFYRSGKQPYSIKIGDKWYSYARFEPFATMLSFITDALTEAKENKEANPINMLQGAALSIASNLQDKTFMRGISDLYNAIAGVEKYGTANSAKRYINKLLASGVPSAVYYTARLKDNVLRNPEGAKETIMARVPGLSEKITPRRNVWGEKIKRGDSILGTATGFYTSKEKPNKVDNAIQEIGFVMGFPQQSINIPKEVMEQLGIPEDRKSIKLTNKEYDTYVKVAGKLTYKAFDQIIGSKQWKAMNSIEQDKLLTRTAQDIRRTVRTFMLEDILKARAKDLTK